MSIPYNTDNDSYVAPGGRITLRVLFQTWAWSGAEQPVSGIQIQIAAVADGTVVVGPTSAGIIVVDEATYTYDWYPAASLTPGDYEVTWTATGPDGPVTISQAVNVVRPPEQTPIPGVYATVADYQAWSGDMLTPVDLLTIVLRRASEVIDNALIGAVYPIDGDSMPTNPAHIDLFMRATCAQAQFEIANGDLARVKSQYASTSMGGVSQSRSQRAQGQMLPPLAPQAAAILHVGGAASVAPLISW